MKKDLKQINMDLGLSSTLVVNLTENQESIVAGISFILDVDFVPDSFEEYAMLPQPYCDIAKKLLKERDQQFAILSAQRLKQFE